MSCTRLHQCCECVCVRDTIGLLLDIRHVSLPRVFSAAAGPITACRFTCVHACVLVRVDVNENHICILMAPASVVFSEQCEAVINWMQTQHEAEQSGRNVP